MLAAAGCNPTETWTKTDGTEGPGMAPGALGYSPDGAMFLCVKAKAAIAQYDLCRLEDGFEANKVTNTDPAGVILCIPQVAIADNAYGWALVAGAGRVKSGGSVGANAGLKVGADGQVIATANNDTIHGIYMTAADGSSNGPCVCMFPAKTT